MKSNTICQVILAGSIILASCQSNNSAKQDESQQTMNETVMNKVTDCKSVRETSLSLMPSMELKIA